MFKKQVETNKEQLRDIILETVVDALKSVSGGNSIFNTDQGKIHYKKDQFGTRSLSIDRLQIDCKEEIEIVHKRIERQIKLFTKLSQKIGLLMEHLNIKFEIVDEKPSVPEHLISKKK